MTTPEGPDFWISPTPSTPQEAFIAEVRDRLSFGRELDDAVHEKIREDEKGEVARTKPFIMPYEHDDVVPVDSEQLHHIPIAGVAFGVSDIYTRTPQESSELPVNVPNDTFVEIVYMDGRPPARLIVNGRGMFFYQHASQLRKVAYPTDQAQKPLEGDLYENGDYAENPGLTIDDLYLLLGQTRIEQQEPPRTNGHVA
ncbi:MAG TPA: hypothetical protein VFI84_00545 [Candidatus Saccharimonadales bacterium]|nr:hypothetical protein [Candidatus Saccharimonadales bacterium]